MNFHQAARTRQMGKKTAVPHAAQLGSLIPPPSRSSSKFSEHSTSASTIIPFPWGCQDSWKTVPTLKAQFRVGARWVSGDTVWWKPHYGLRTKGQSKALEGLGHWPNSRGKEWGGREHVLELTVIGAESWGVSAGGGVGQDEVGGRVFM